MRHEERKALAYVWIKPLVAVLYWSLLLSIGLFITGFLYQLHNLATSFDGKAWTLLVIWMLGIVLASGIMVTIIATTVHAVRYESSPFEGSLSSAIVTILSKKRWNWVGGWRIGVDWAFDANKQICIYMRLVAEANDPKLLDRAVPSFSYSDWVTYGNKTMDLLKEAYYRLTATDASLRVRETVNTQLSRFAAICRKDEDWTRRGLPKDELIEFLVESCSFPTHSTAGVFFTSFRDNNADLLEISELPVEKCIANILCTYDQEKWLGIRAEIFLRAVKHCNSLLDSGKEDEVSQILSHVDPCSVLRSIAPRPYFPDFPKFVARGREIEVLRGISASLNDPKYYRDHTSFIAGVLGYIIAGIDRALDFPPDIDLSPLIASICEEKYAEYWSSLSDAAMIYLDRCNTSSLSNPEAIFKFLRLCTDRAPSSNQDEDFRTREVTQGRVRALLAKYQSLFSQAVDAGAIEAPSFLPTGPFISRSNSTSSVRIEMSDLTP